MKELPENSLALLKHLEFQQGHPDFKYLEFDIRETKDGNLVVFHDETLRRMLPNKGANVKSYKKLRTPGTDSYVDDLSRKPIFLWKVSDLTLEQLKTLSLEGREPDPGDPELYLVPTLDEYMELIGDRLSKPIVFEIKKVNSPEGRGKLTDAILNYKKRKNGNQISSTLYNSFPYQQVSVINIKGLKRNFDDPQEFCNTLKKQGVNIYRGWTHDSPCDFLYTGDRHSQRKKIESWVLRIPKQVAVKHHIVEVEQDLDPANYHKPRIVHFEPKSKTKPRRFIYSPVERTDTVLNRLRKINKDKLIVFLHGRGKHPGKGEPMLVDLSKEHDSAVLMFNWDSWICQSNCKNIMEVYSSKHPYGNAKAAAPFLARFLRDLSSFKKQNPEIKISMLMHSMGNIVFKEMMEQPEILERHWESYTTQSAFIDNLILNSADVDREGHKKWLQNVKIAKDIFVTLSDRDFALGSVELMLYRPLLGQGFKDNESVNSFSNNAHYLDFSKISRSHRKFGVENTHLKQFFSSAFGDDSWEKCPYNISIDMKKFDYQCVN